MESTIKRRTFIKNCIALPTICAAGVSPPLAVNLRAGISKELGPKIKISLNAFSFNKALLAGEMSLSELLEFTARCGFEAIDITGYYFTGYPEVPSPQVVNEFKRNAFVFGLDISGTGVRNDFTVSDSERRKSEIQLVKKWIELAADLGAPVVRVFAGRSEPKGDEWAETAKLVADGINECAEYGSQYGVMVALQNHAHFLKTAKQVNTVMDMVNSDWAGLMLDIGSYPTNDPYDDIARTVSHAITWQVKENINYVDREEKTNFHKIAKIARDANYRGYMPLETLGAGDPKVKVRHLLQEFQTALRETR